jgi:hypothetical protein
VFRTGTPVGEHWDGRFAFVNDITCKRSGYPAEWFIGRSYLDAVGVECKDRLRRGFQTIANTNITKKKINFQSYILSLS